MKIKREFWTMWRAVPGREDVCTRHKTIDAAIKSMAACERVGGADHRLVEVAEVVPYAPKAKR